MTACELKLNDLNIHQYPHLGIVRARMGAPQVLGLRWYMRCYSMKLHVTFEVPKTC